MSEFPFLFRVEGNSEHERLAWIRDRKEPLEQRLRTGGAVLFAGAGAIDAALFESFSELFFVKNLDYVGGDSPRTRVSDRVYTSTEFPAQYPISLHNELSYANAWPASLLFCCILPAESGGETPIADSRAILRDLEASVAEEFSRRGVRYVRNLHGGAGFGRSWQQTFETDDRVTVERHCNDTDTDFEWKADGGLRLLQTRHAVATHPITQERVWFNQADQYHPSAQSAPVRESMRGVYGDDPNDLPTYVTFGDGGAIADEALDHVRAVVAGHTVMFPWQAGDVLWVDNMLVCHGRMPYRGKRKILVTMA